MIRPFTCVCMLMAGASGLYLYQAKHRAQLLDREIAATMHAAELARERSGVLRAEWTLLNDPERLAALASRFLALKTTQPGQFTNLAELDSRIPAVRATARRPDTTDEPGTEPASPAAGTAEPAKVATASSATTPAAAPAPIRVAAAAAPHPPPRPLDHRPRELAFGYGRGVAAAPPTSASVLGPISAPVPMVTPISTPVLARPGLGYQPPQMPAGVPAPAPMPPPMLGSALGMARTPPPSGLPLRYVN